MDLLEFQKKIPLILLFKEGDRPISPHPELPPFIHDEKPSLAIESSPKELSPQKPNDFTDLTEKSKEKINIEDEKKMHFLTTNSNYVGLSYSTEGDKYSLMHLGNERFTCHMNGRQSLSLTLEKNDESNKTEIEIINNNSVDNSSVNYETVNAQTNVINIQADKSSRERKFKEKSNACSGKISGDNHSIEPVGYKEKKKKISVKNRKKSKHLETPESKRRKKIICRSEEESQHPSDLIDLPGKEIEKSLNEDEKMKNFLPPNLNYVGSSYSSKDKKHSLVHLGNDRFTCHSNEGKFLSWSLEKNDESNKTESEIINSSVNDQTVNAEANIDKSEKSSPIVNTENISDNDCKIKPVHIHPIIRVLEKIRKVKGERVIETNDLFKSLLATLRNSFHSPRTEILAVIFQYISSSKVNPVVSFLVKNDYTVFILGYEKALVEALIKIEQNNEKHLGLVKSTTTSLTNLILEKTHLSKTGLAAFCRLISLICERKKLNFIQKLASDLIKKPHHNSVFLIANIIGCCREMFSIKQNSKECEVILLSAIAYGIQKRLCNNPSSEGRILQTVFSNFMMAPATKDPSETVKIAIENLKKIINERPTENDFIYLEPIVIFSSIEGEEWAMENIVKHFLLPTLIEFAIRIENERAFSVLMELYVEIGIYVPEGSSVGASCALLKFFNMKDAFTYVKRTSAIYLTKLCLFKKYVIMPELLEWIKENESSLEGTMLESSMKRLLISEEPFINKDEIIDC